MSVENPVISGKNIGFKASESLKKELNPVVENKLLNLSYNKLCNYVNTVFSNEVPNFLAKRLKILGEGQNITFSSTKIEETHKNNKQSLMVCGYYDYKTDQIFYREEANEFTVIHEMLHFVTHKIENENKTGLIRTIGFEQHDKGENIINKMLNEGLTNWITLAIKNKMGIGITDTLSHLDSTLITSEVFDDYSPAMSYKTAMTKIMNYLKYGVKEKNVKKSDKNKNIEYFYETILPALVKSYLISEPVTFFNYLDSLPAADHKNKKTSIELQEEAEEQSLTDIHDLQKKIIEVGNIVNFSLAFPNILKKYMREFVKVSTGKDNTLPVKYVFPEYAFYQNKEFNALINNKKYYLRLDYVRYCDQILYYKKEGHKKFINQNLLPMMWEGLKLFNYKHEKILSDTDFFTNEDILNFLSKSPKLEAKIYLTDFLDYSHIKMSDEEIENVLIKSGNPQAVSINKMHKLEKDLLDKLLN